MAYAAPLAEQMFALETVAELGRLATLPAFEGAGPELARAVLEESAKLAEDMFAPLNRIGDREGARWRADGVTLPDGFADAYRRYAEGRWSGLAASPADGGQGLPFVLACAAQEQFTSANMAFSLCMMLTQGAIEALSVHASEAQKRLYLSRLVSGEWTGTMNLTEPQAGSDVGALRTVAEPAGDDSYRIRGSKIFITWGEHDLAPNIVHLVLARLPGAPAGTKGISLFLVPKYLVDADGVPGAHNDLRCVSIEHKLGIHASPTCTMSFGDEGNCVGYLVGSEGGGMRAMFTMMNHARINVGLQGVAVAEAACQHAIAYARERVQSAKGADGPVPIAEHADVRRMLMSLRATTEAIRALTYYTAAAVDRAHGEPDAGAAARARGLADLLTPVTKAFATDMGVEMASLAIQVFGGVGYVEETGAAQYLRDARIAPIYEGTNGIQAMDLVGRKLALDGGAHWRRLFDEIGGFAAARAADDRFGAAYDCLTDALAALYRATRWMIEAHASGVDAIGAGAATYLRMFGTVVSGWLLLRQARVAGERLEAGGDAFLEGRIGIARFHAEQMLPPAAALLDPIRRSAATLFEPSVDALFR